MRVWAFAAFFLGLVGGVVRAADPRALFEEAQKAYDGGRFDEAISRYEALLEEGYQSCEIYFNLGNAWFKKGELAKAIVFYRRAWMMSPRDPAVRANLEYALRSAGALLPETSGAEGLFFLVSRRGWLQTAIFCWWLGCGLVVLRYLLPARPRGLAHIAAVLLVLAAVALAGVWTWDRLADRPEVVITQPGTQALFAPLEGSTPHFALPVGSLARVLERSGSWLRVRLSGKSGWVPESATLAVGYVWAKP